MNPTVVLTARQGANPAKYYETLSLVNAGVRLAAASGSLSWWQAYLQAMELSRSCDGLLLSGGGDPQPELYGKTPDGTPPDQIDIRRDILELALINAFAAARKPVLGICRGVQILNVAFGGTLLQDIPGHRQIEDKDGEHSVILSEVPPGGPLGGLIHEGLGGGGASLKVNSAHHQAVGVPGSGLSVWCVSEDGTVEGLAHAGLPVAGVQWHPERHQATREIVFSAFVSLM